MKARILNREFFEGKAEEVARNLIGKVICCEKDGQDYQITKTEAYYHDEKDYDGHYFCYGVKKDNGQNSKTYSTIPLFRYPGTWCIYGGQLLLSVTSSKFSDNVLIKEIKTQNNEVYTTDKIAKTLRIYQKKEPSNYWDFHGLDSLASEATLYLMEGQDIQNIAITKGARKNIRNDQPYQFSVAVE